MFTPSFSETTALVEVLEHKSFTKAAVQLGLSPSRVSELVRNLEERLGVRLVERTTRSVAPTTAGERLLERLRPLLDGYQAALQSVDDFRTKLAGTLRLTVPPPAADFVLAAAVAESVRDIPISFSTCPLTVRSSISLKGASMPEYTRASESKQT